MSEELTNEHLQVLKPTPEEIYGATTEEWLQRWDNNQVVHSIEMGGLGPGYEQAIQVTAAEIVRHLINGPYNRAVGLTEEDFDRIRTFAMEDQTIKDLGGITGAMFGGAANLAIMLWKHGPVKVMQDERVKDRHILVMKKFASI